MTRQASTFCTTHQLNFFLLNDPKYTIKVNRTFKSTQLLKHNNVRSTILLPLSLCLSLLISTKSQLLNIPQDSEHKGPGPAHLFLRQASSDCSLHPWRNVLQMMAKQAVATLAMHTPLTQSHRPICADSCSGLVICSGDMAGPVLRARTHLQHAVDALRSE